MEITAFHLKAPPHHVYTSSDKHKNYILHKNITLIKHQSTPKHPIQIQLPLHRPKSVPIQPVEVKPQPRKTNPTPRTTTSDILYLMDSLNLTIPLDIYISLIKECTKIGDPLKAIELHLHMRKSGVCLNITLANRLLLMYMCCGCFEYARQLFDQMRVRNFNSRAVMIAGYVENGKHREAIDLFIEMLIEEKFRDAHDDEIKFAVSGTLVCVLKACVNTTDLELGMQIHGWLLKMGFSRNAVLTSFLISFYGKCKCSAGAEICFDKVCCRNTAVWTARIANFCREEKFEGAVNVFREMGREGVKKNSYTFSSVLKACGQMGDGGYCGRQVHANVIKVGAEFNGYVQCALIDVYGRYGLVKDATRAFKTSEDTRTIACWNAMLTAFIQHGFCIQAIKLLYKMKAAGLVPPESLFNEVKLICGSRNLEQD
ncbi:Pentatricopeptide repeat-containing protein [Abeliophyllum distichum]|uniref:Pentatricopeptide repeat-containing protein n=1 Tax=Abeliophyllum distichum TaxID=126358 RepID=A0ABD1UKA1_9LAMI